MIQSGRKLEKLLIPAGSDRDNPDVAGRTECLQELFAAWQEGRLDKEWEMIIDSHLVPAKTQEGRG